MGRPPFYGIGGVFLWFLLWLFFYAVISGFHQGVASQSYRKYWYYDSSLALLAVVGFVFYRRPRLLALSRWRPKWLDFAVGISFGVLVPAVLWLAVRDPVSSLNLHPLFSYSAFIIPVACLTPIVEEIFCRGVILKSFKSLMPRALAVLLTTLLVCLVHRSFWVVLPSQLMLSIVYVALGDSLPASIAAHITNNAFVTLLTTGIFEKWHTYIWSLAK